MVEKMEVYKCGVCGNITEVMHVGGGTLACCGRDMESLVEKTEEEGLEKHKPVIEKTGNGVKVSVGSVPHPMEEKHFIEWIEIIADGKVCRKYLNPGDPPSVEFPISAEKVEAREHCNIHGLWKG